MLQFPLNLVDQLFTATVNFILCVKEIPTPFAPFSLQRFDLLLPGQLFFQRQCGNIRFSGFFDMAVQFLDLAL